MGLSSLNGQALGSQSRVSGFESPRVHWALQERLVNDCSVKCVREVRASEILQMLGGCQGDKRLC